jgi:hypothetical protein
MKFDRLRQSLKDDFERALGRQAVEKGWITPQQLELAWSERADRQRLTEILVAKGWMTAERLAELARAAVRDDLARSVPVPAEAQGPTIEDCIVVGNGKAWDRKLGRWVRLEPGIPLPPHAHLLPPLRAFTHDGRSYCVSPWADAADWSRLSGRRKLEAIRDAALALHAAHERGLFHGRIDASSILVGDAVWLKGFTGTGSAAEDVDALQSLLPLKLPKCATALELSQQVRPRKKSIVF